MYGSPKGSSSEVVRENLSKTLKLLELASYDEPDLVVLTEGFSTRGLPLRVAVKVAQELEGEVVTTIARAAAEYGTYIVCPLYLREGGRVFNSAVLLDDGGRVAGVYHKMFPTIREIEAGITPGSEPGVFDTRFGKLGVVICFDVNFDEPFREFESRGVKLVAFPSAFPGGMLLPLRAIHGKFYLVSAVWEGESVIVDPLGRVLARSSTYNPVITAEINLDFMVLHLDYNYLKFPQLKKRFGKNVRVCVSRPEALVLISSEADLSMSEIAAKLGLEERDEYFDRSRRIIEEARSAANQQ